MRKKLVRKIEEVRLEYNSLLEEIETYKLNVNEKKIVSEIITTSIAHESITLDAISS